MSIVGSAGLYETVTNPATLYDLIERFNGSALQLICRMVTRDAKRRIENFNGPASLHNARHTAISRNPRPPPDKKIPWLERTVLDFERALGSGKRRYEHISAVKLAGLEVERAASVFAHVKAAINVEKGTRLNEIARVGGRRT